MTRPLTRSIRFMPPAFFPRSRSLKPHFELRLAFEHPIVISKNEGPIQQQDDCSEKIEMNLRKFQENSKAKEINNRWNSDEWFVSILLWGFFFSSLFFEKLFMTPEVIVERSKLTELTIENQKFNTDSICMMSRSTSLCCSLASWRSSGDLVLLAELKVAWKALKALSSLQTKITISLLTVRLLGRIHRIIFLMPVRILTREMIWLTLLVADLREASSRIISLFWPDTGFKSKIRLHY